MIEQYIITFDTEKEDDGSERSEFNAKIHAYEDLRRLKIAIWDFDQSLRTQLKYEENPKWDSDTVEILRDKLYQLLQESKVSIED